MKGDHRYDIIQLKKLTNYAQSAVYELYLRYSKDLTPLLPVEERTVHSALNHVVKILAEAQTKAEKLINKIESETENEF